MSAIALAKLLVVRRTRTEHLVKGEVRIIPNTAWHLTKAFGATPVCCMNMQVDHDLVEVRGATDLFGIEPLVAA